MSALSNIASGDAFTPATTLEHPRSVRVNFQVFNAAIVYQLGRGRGGVVYSGDVFLGPGIYSLDRVCDGVRFRSAAAGQPAQVTVELLAVEEVGELA